VTSIGPPHWSWMWFQRPRAIPKQSKPDPKFAVEAGTRIVTL
jgi:hypothetical protein